MEDFIDEISFHFISFIDNLDPENVEYYHKFPNQTRNPKEAVYEDDVLYFGTEDMQPELHDPEDRFCWF